MEMTYFLDGIVVGFAMAIPVGPIGILCIRKTINEGRLRGLIIGLGAATADLLYSAIAAFGLTIISDTLYSQKVLIRIIGGALLLYLGVKIFLAQPKNPKFNVNGTGMLKSYLTTIFLTLTNPLTIFAFIAIFAALNLSDTLGYISASALIVGVFIGSALWFVILSYGVTLFRDKINHNGLHWVNKIAGILIIISAFITVGSLL